MGALDQSYDILKTLAISKYITSQTSIILLKQLFASDINSPRAFSQITDLSSLIAILEKRNVLSPINIEAFEKIYKELELNIRVLNDHRRLKEKEKRCSFTTKYEDVKEVRSPKLNFSGHNLIFPRSKNITRTCSTSQSVLSDRVINVVCSQIGSSWKSLARYLKVVPEIKIEQIESAGVYSCAEAAGLILQDYQDRIMDPAEIRSRLLKALRLVNRTDILEQVECLYLREL